MAETFLSEALRFESAYYSILEMVRLLTRSTYPGAGRNLHIGVISISRLSSL